MEKHYEQTTLTRKVTELSNNEVFVFATDVQGNHTHSAARYACKKFGAKPGTLGLQGQSYAIPIDMKNPNVMKPYIYDFINFVKTHPTNRFLITRMGNEKAAFDSDEFTTNENDELMANLFEELEHTPNAVLPIEWSLMMNMPERNIFHKEKIDKVIDETYLKELCKQYRYEIGAGVKWNLPKITIRYTSGNEFMYADFGDFFFYEDELYVFTHETNNDGKHNKILHPTFCEKLYDAFIHNNSDFLNQAYELFGKRMVYASIEHYKDIQTSNIIREIFQDECWNQGMAHKMIFAGVQTPFKDIYDTWIYTGDVVSATKETDEEMLPYPVGTNTGWNLYAFMLDNHCVPLEECKSFKRIGNVFFNLDESPKTIGERNSDFLNEAYGSYGNDCDFDLAMRKVVSAPYTSECSQYIL